MKTKLKQSLVLTLAFVLCLANVPTSVFAEDEQGDLPQETIVLADDGTLEEEGEGKQTQPDSEEQDPDGEEQPDEESINQVEEGSADEQQSPSLPVATYRLHRIGSAQWSDGEGWLTYAEHQKGLEESEQSGEGNTKPVALDSLEVRFDDESLRDVTYRVRDNNGTWQEEATKAPKAATSKEAITGIEIQLPEAAIEQYDLWYRARNADGTWLDWVLAGRQLQTKDNAPLYDVEVLLVAKGETPTEGTIAPEEAADQNSAEDGKGEQDPKVTGQADTEDQKAPNAEDSDGQSPSEDGIKAEASAPEVEYKAHVQNIGWQNWVKNGALAGTSGRGLRVEGFYFHLKNADGDVLCQSHVQNVGWQDWVPGNKLAGTQSRGLRVEAIKLKLDGNISKTHDIYYRAHVQNVGWQGWSKNGELAGTSGRSLRVEAIEVMLVRKGDTVPFDGDSGTDYANMLSSRTPGVRYQAHVQNIGWQNEVSNGATAGTSGKSYRVEALRITTTGIDGGIKYNMHVQNIGWQGWRSNGEMAGTSGKSYRVEAMQIELTGNARNQYSIYYRAHVQNVGWMAWAKDGALCGSSGRGWRMEAIQIKLVPHSQAGPSGAGAVSMAYLGDISVLYNAHALNGNWIGEQSNGGTGGTTGQSGRIDLISAKLAGASGSGIRYSVQSEAGSWKTWAYDGASVGQSGKKVTAIRFELTGDASKYYDIWYRAHCANVGWLGWTKNGGDAGADSVAYPIEAYQVMIVGKNSTAPGSTTRPYHFARQLNGVDVSGHDWGNGPSAGPLRLNEVEGDFFIIKATEGLQGTIYNTRYRQMAEQALSTGRLIGFYHYANGEDPIKEADSFYEAIKDYRGRAIACLDWEDQGNDLFDTGKDVTWCKKFLDRLKSRFGGTPVLYTSKNYTNAYDWSSVAASYPLWGAEYPDYEDVYGYQSSPWQSSRPWGAWGTYPTIFQYTGTGVLSKNGGCEYFDFDVFFGSAADWRALQG